MAGGDEHTQLLLDHIRATWPYWDRHGGRDHFLFVPADRGTCPWGSRFSDLIRIVHFGMHSTRTNHNPHFGHQGHPGEAGWEDQTLLLMFMCSHACACSGGGVGWGGGGGSKAGTWAGRHQASHPPRLGPMCLPGLLECCARRVWVLQPAEGHCGGAARQGKEPILQRHSPHDG